MTKAGRVFLIVLDSLGAGEAPDAAQFGDAGAFTLKSLWKTGKLRIPTLIGMGIGTIEGLSFLGVTDTPTACVARLTEASMGKDTTIGHWELAGYCSKKPLPTFPNGFPQSFLNAFSERVGRGVLCNLPYSGTDVIRDYGEEHLRTGALIVYTSADSVCQIAAHTDTVPLEELYAICETAREMLRGELGVGRVIARPFTGEAGRFVRTADRRDYSLEPPVLMLPDAVKSAGMDSVAIGKIADIFAGRGFTRFLRTHSNAEGMELTEALMTEAFSGLCFVNLVDFDMLWGHRRDAVGYAEGLNAFDAWLGRIVSELREDDVLMITADHGCDPGFIATTDHTREYVPFVMYGKQIAPKALGTKESFSDVAATVCELLGVSLACDGKSMI